LEAGIERHFFYEIGSEILESGSFLLTFKVDHQYVTGSLVDHVISDGANYSIEGAGLMRTEMVTTVRRN